MNKTNKTNIQAARTSGSIAFAKGIESAPILDKEFYDSLDINGMSHKQRMDMFKAWHRGWAEANIAAAA